MVMPDASFVTYQSPLFPFRSLPAATPLPTFAVGPSLPLPPPSFRLPSLAMMNQDFDAAENASSAANQDAAHKAALSFILSSSGSESESDEPKSRKRNSVNEPTIAKRRRSVTGAAVSPLTSIPTTATVAAAARPAPSKKGSKFCTVEGCTSRAKHAKRCWKHGGWVRCKVSECNNRAKSKGVCWSHGGGTVCSFESCDTIAVSNGFCWAHGGGKRCQVPNCSKPAYERTQNYCQAHYGEFGESKTS
ncbi:WRKY transcription factor 19 [Phytophthora cinnamomi]|uniref:WRKY transcription factor 19 n=1 Tax=Phytophthora cinnamomi TaxID=4785 RepID=UPI00355976C5|nr:WRKY transcription factor 19 [Phytophthora cinnamomi]